MALEAKPTNYGGVRMRSRLEARWAAFFDLCGWLWKYEPVKLEGWTPDFALTPPCGTEMLVEVKPICWLGTWESWAREMQHPKIQKVLGWRAPVLVLGASPGGLEYSGAAYPSIGLIVYGGTLAAANVQFMEDSADWTLAQGFFAVENYRAPPWREVDSRWTQTLVKTRSDRADT